MVKALGSKENFFWHHWRCKVSHKSQHSSFKSWKYFWLSSTLFLLGIIFSEFSTIPLEQFNVPAISWCENSYCPTKLDSGMLSSRHFFLKTNISRLYHHPLRGFFRGVQQKHDIFGQNYKFLYGRPPKVASEGWKSRTKKFVLNKQRGSVIHHGYLRPLPTPFPYSTSMVIPHFQQYERRMEITNMRAVNAWQN